MVVAFMPLNVEQKGLVVVTDVENSLAIRSEEKVENFATAYNYHQQGKIVEFNFVRNRWVIPKQFGLRRVTWSGIKGMPLRDKEYGNLIQFNFVGNRWVGPKKFGLRWVT